MQIETMVFLGWASVPVVAYGVGMSFLRLRGRKTAPSGGGGGDASARLEELRRRPVQGGTTRGRMAEAMLLADGPVAASLTSPRD